MIHGIVHNIIIYSLQISKEYTHTHYVPSYVITRDSLLLLIYCYHIISESS